MHFIQRIWIVVIDDDEFSVNSASTTHEGALECAASFIRRFTRDVWGEDAYGDTTRSEHPELMRLLATEDHAGIYKAFQEIAYPAGGPYVRIEETSLLSQEPVSKAES